jgi:hypothetical protein
MTTLIEFQRAIDARMRRGESFSTIEDELIEPSGCPTMSRPVE